MSDFPRRRLLAATGTALTGAVAGCTGSDDSDDEPDSGNGTGNGDDDGNGNDVENESASDGPTGTLLGDITIENLDDDAHTVDVIVEFDGEPEHWTTHDLAGGDGTDLERDWSTDPGAFRVLARLDGGDPTRITPTRWNDPDCVNVFVLIGREGRLTISGDTGGGPCGDGEATVDDAEGETGSES